MALITPKKKQWTSLRLAVVFAGAVLFTANARASISPPAFLDSSSGSSEQNESDPQNDEAFGFDKAIQANMSSRKLLFELNFAELTDQIENPEASALSDRISKFIEEDDLKSAEALKRQLKTKYPDAWIALVWDAYFSVLNGDIDLAIKNARRVIENNQDDARVFFLIINLYLKNGDPSNAEKYNDMLLVRYPHLGHGIYIKGRIAQLRQHYDEAESFYNDALRIDPTAYFVLLDIADIYNEKNQIQKALDVLNVFLSEFPDNTFVLYKKTLLLMSIGRIGEAQAIYDELGVGLKESEGGQMMALALAYKAKAYDGAISICEALIKKYPQERNFYTVLFSLYLDKQDFESAEGLREKITKKFNDPSWGDELQARVSLARNQYGEAIGLYEKVLKSGKGGEDAYFNLIYAYREQGDLAKVLEVCKEASVKYPENYAFRKLVARSLRDTGQYEESIKEYHYAISLKPYKIGGYIGLASSYNANKEYDKAIEANLKAIAIYPYYAEPYWGIALSYLNKGDHEKALEYALKSVETDPAEGLYQQALAQIYKQKSECELARRVCEEILEKVANRVDGLIWQGKCFAGIDHNDAAEASFLEAVRLSPDSLTAFDWLVDIYQRKEDYTNVVKFAERIIELNPDHDQAYLSEIVAYINMGETDKADALLNSLPDRIKDQKVLSDYYVNVGSAFNGKVPDKERTIKAVRCFAKAAEINPSSHYPYLNLALTYGYTHFEDIRNEGYAVDFFEKVIGVNKDPENYYLYSLFLRSVHETDKAIDVLKESLGLNPGHFNSYILLAELYIDKKDVKASIEICQEAEGIDPGNIKTLRVLARAYEARNDGKSAFETYTRIVETNPDNPVGYYDLAFFLQKHDKLDPAIKSAELSIEKGSTEYNPYEVLGICYHKKNQPDMAEKYFKKAVELGPETIAQNSLGYFYLTQKRFEESLEHLQIAAKYTKGYNLGLVYNNLASLFFQSGQYEQALSYYDKAIELYNEYGDPVRAKNLEQHLYQIGLKK